MLKTSRKILKLNLVGLVDWVSKEAVFQLNSDKL
jgi:hypothetical protein